jgi:hypothetical protein
MARRSMTETCVDRIEYLMEVLEPPKFTARSASQKYHILLDYGTGREY